MNRNLDDALRTNAYGICDELPVGIALCNHEGCVTDCNRYYLGILGVSREEILGYNIFDSYNFTDEVMEKIRTSDSYQYDVLYTMPRDVFANASTDMISISVKIVRNTEEERTIGYTVYLTNHTNEWKKYEEQLNAQDRRYRDLVDNLPLNYTHTKLIFGEDGQIVDYLNMSGNKSCEDFYTAHHMTWGSTLASKFLSETGSIIIGKLNELRNNGETGGHFVYEASEVGEIYEMVVVFEGDDWVNLISVPITALELEKRSAEIRLSEEILNKQEAELKRKQAEAEYNKLLKEQLSIFDALADSYANVYIVDTANETLRVLKLNGYITTGVDSDKEKIYPYDVVKNQYVSERVHPDDQEMMMSALSIKSVEEGLTNVNEYIGNYRILDDGETHYYQYKYVRLKNVDYLIAGFQNVDDIITEQREYQEQLTHALVEAQQASKAKTNFLNNMSHDIRTPMNAIIGFTSLAQTHIEEQEKVQEYLAKISTSSVHLLDLINDILDKSRFDSGTVKLEEKFVHMPTLLHEVMTMVQELASAKNQTLSIEFQDVVHEDVKTDKLRLRQVLLNIVGNAVKFTQPGGNIDVRIAEKPCKLQQCATYIFTVKDDGIGMSKEFVGHIFENFSRERSSTVSGVQGTGLGMAIVKNIVDMMEGDITVESEEGKGSLFTVTLQFRITDESIDGEIDPVLQDQKTKAQIFGNEEDSKENAKNSYDYSGKHVLLVEDNELNREIATAILEETGMVIDCVCDGDEAVHTIDSESSGKYDLILMDVQMPRMDGYTATRKIRSLADTTKASIPIVAMTANAFEEDKKKAYDSGMNGHIVKPISIEAIAKVLDEIFDLNAKV